MTWRFVLIFLLGVLVGVARPQDIRHPDGTHAFPGSLRVGKSVRIGSAGAVTNPLTVSPTAPNSVSSGSGSDGAAITLTGQAGGATTDTTSDYGGVGGYVEITAGAGGTAPSGSTNGDGGNVELRAGAAGAGAGTAANQGNIIAEGRYITISGNLQFSSIPQTLGTDDTTVTATQSVVILKSTSATPSNRTMVMPGHTQGGRLVTLVWDSLYAAELLDDSATSTATGNVRLVTDWTPTRYDTLTLLSLSSGGSYDWIEMNRTGAVPTTTTTTTTTSTTTTTTSTTTTTT